MPQPSRTGAWLVAGVIIGLILAFGLFQASYVVRGVVLGGRTPIADQPAVTVADGSIDLLTNGTWTADTAGHFILNEKDTDQSSGFYIDFTQEAGEKCDPVPNVRIDAISATLTSSTRDTHVIDIADHKLRVAKGLDAKVYPSTLMLDGGGGSAEGLDHLETLAITTTGNATLTCKFAEPSPGGTPNLFTLSPHWK